MIFEIIKRLREFGLETAIDRFYSNYPGKVTRNDDPQQQGRVKLTSPSLGRSDELLHWAYPISPFAGSNYGFYFPPEAGDAVWVWFENGEAQSPCYAGSWFCNPSDSKSPSGSCVPAEFKMSTAASPTRRGIKTKRGHGLLFEDDENASSVELWAGEQEEPGSAATKQRWLRMQNSPDTEKTIVIGSVSGHETEWSDAVNEVWVRTKTAGGHKFYMDDTDNRILVQSKNGNTFLIDDAKNDVTIRTVGQHEVVLSDSERSIRVVSTGRHSVTIDDRLGGVEAKTATGRALSMHDVSQTTTLITPTGQIVSQAPTGTTITDPGAVTVQAAGALSLTGAGLNLASAGGGPTVQTASGTSISNFTGDKTETFAGALTQAIAGIWSVAVVGVAQILSVFGVEVGGPGTKYYLIDERFLTTFLAHVHNSAAVGIPTGPPIWVTPVPPPTPGNVTTIMTKAN
jgi:hypothetical protein